MANKTENMSAYQHQWQKENRDRITLTVPKGDKEKIKEHAKSMDESVIAFINRAIKEAMERDKEKE